MGAEGFWDDQGNAAKVSAEHARMQAAVKPVVDKFSADYDPAKVKLFNAELARIRGAN